MNFHPGHIVERAAAAAAQAVLNWTAKRVDPARRQWIEAVRGEVDAIDGGWSKLTWAVGGVRLVAFELDGRRRIVRALGKWETALGVLVFVSVIAAAQQVVPLGTTVLVGSACALAGWLIVRRRLRGRHNRVVLGMPLPALVPVVAIGILLIAGASAAVGAATQLDTQCTTAHAPTGYPPASVISATDYLALGDYDYDRGACDQAIADYTRAIDLDPAFAAAYNNRAYTAMRQQDYAAALPDLDRAIELRPDYSNALMNRGDIYNYYYRIDRPRAIADYDRVIGLGQKAHTSVCGHRLLAYYDGWSAGVALNILTRGVDGGCDIGHSAT